VQKIIFSGGTIVDGSGLPSFKGDLLVTGDRITSIGGTYDEAAALVLDVSGLVVAPGFIDIHSHSDYYLIIDPLGRSKVMQGVTTEVGGNCGYAAAPIKGDLLAERTKAYKEQFGITHDWSTLEEYFDRLSAGGISLNYAQLVGVNSIRASILGYEDREPTAGELDEMLKMISGALDAGAIGISFGLAYSPLSYAKRDELVAYAKLAAERGVPLSVHIRSEGDGLVEAVEEVLTIAKKTGVSLQISHLKAMWEKNWGKLDKVFSLIENAIAEGVKVSCDRYPYLAANTSLQSILPGWVLAGGKEKTIDRLKDDGIRANISAELMEGKGGDYWDKVMVSRLVSKDNRWMEGKTITEISDSLGKEPLESYYGVLIDEELQADAIYVSMKEENLRRVLSKEYVMIASDAGTHSHNGPLGEGFPHPRGFGTFPMVLGKYVREEGLINLPTAIQKMTSWPADKFGLVERGRLEGGYYADIVVFDPRSISDRASYSAPKEYPAGIVYVLVNGDFAVKRGLHSGAKSGRILTKKRRS